MISAECIAGFQHNLKRTARKWTCLVIGSSVWTRGGKMKNSVIFAVSQERYFYLWPGFSIKYWRWTSKDSFDDMTQSGGSAEAESDIVQSGEAWALWFAKRRFVFCTLLPAPRVCPQIVFAMEKLEDAHMRSGHPPTPSKDITRYDPQHESKTERPKSPSAPLIRLLSGVVINRKASSLRAPRRSATYGLLHVLYLILRQKRRLGRECDWFWFQNHDKTTGHTLNPATRYDSFSHSLPFPTSFLLSDLFFLLANSSRHLAQPPPSIWCFIKKQACHSIPHRGCCHGHHRQTV